MDNLNLIKQFKLLESRSRGDLGIFATRLGGASVHFNADQKFFMCSTFKVPIAICFLQKVEREQLDLTDTVPVTEYDLRIGMTGALNRRDYSKPVTVSYHDLLHYMLQESCNSSSDLIFRAAGGADAMRKFFRAASIDDMSITKSILDIFAAWDGIENLPADGKVTLAEYKNLEQAVTPEQLARAKSQYQRQDGDATPAAMNRLLEKLVKGKLLSKTHTHWLLDIMRGCKTGKMRLQALLPEHIDVAHKTGTITGCCCDVGLVDHDLVVTVFLKNSTLDANACERIVAEAGLMIYENLKRGL